MADDTDDSGGVILEGPFDPDAQATVTDFIDYTEYLPADLIRSLTLIRGLDETYLEATQKVHELTKIYGQLPDLPPESRPKPQDLREQISIQLDRALNAREASYAEACRLYDVVDRHFDRLGCIKKKLESLPKPPSREPTPPPAPASPENKRSRSGRKTEEGPTRITLRVEGQRPSRDAVPKSRSRRSVVSGFDPDSPIASTEQSDNGGEPREQSRDAVKAEKSPEVSETKKEKQPKRTRRAGTNGRSSVAGISTSNALAMLKPPPPDAKIGSEDLPWLRLTEWEMTKLRKKMKKNAVWQPSEIMINRELAKSGRGWEGYRAAKARAEATGEELIDCDDIMNNYIPGKLTRKSDVNADTVPMEETKTVNRGMKLNEAKKLKRENLAREQAALAAAEAEMAAKRLGDIGSTFKNLFSSPMNGVSGLLPSSSKPNGAAAEEATKEKEKAKSPKKRKQEDVPEAPPSNQLDANAAEASKPATKRRKTNKTTPVEATPSSEAPPASSTTAAAAATTAADAKSSVPSSPPTGTKSTRQSNPPISGPAASVAARKASKTPTPPSTRPPSRRRSAAASVEPVSREHLRRKSTTPAARTPVPEPSRASSTAPSRRRKRPAPGPVSSSQDGGAAVSYGRRKAKPTKKRAQGKESTAPKGEDYRIDEDGVLEEIDPNEPRYCLCGDVSFGTMICCENADVSVSSIYILMCAC